MYSVLVFGDYGDNIPKDGEGNVPEKGDRPEEFAYPVYSNAGSEVGDTHDGISEYAEFSDWWIGEGFADWVNSAKLAVQKLVSELSENRKNGTASEYDLEILGNLISANIIPSIKEDKMRTPDDIAKLITEDIRSNNGLVESLFGQKVVEGEKPIDMFLGAIDRSYLDLDLNNPKVAALAKRTFGGIPTPEQLRNMIIGSSQSDELKHEILRQIGTPAHEPTQSTGSGVVEVHHKNGKVYKGVKVVDASDYVYLMLDDVPGQWRRTSQILAKRKRKWQAFPDVFEIMVDPKTKSKFVRHNGKFITIKKDNIVKVS